MITKNDIKLIRSLGRRSAREQQRLFVAEGHKAISELINYFECSLLIGTEHDLSPITERQSPRRIEVVPDSFSFDRISSLESPRTIVALFCIPNDRIPQAAELNAPALLLDGIQDPGNLGTIIRTANWFGLDNILLSAGTVDVYSPKVVQACMGALAGVNIYKIGDPTEYLHNANKLQIPIIGTFLNAPALYDTQLPSTEDAAILVLGNEGRGISPEIAKLCNVQIHIPPGKGKHRHTESLNVAVANAIILAHWYCQA